MKKQLNQGQINTASFEMQDFATETGGNVEAFANYFYDVAKALGYDTDKFVELMESKFSKECADVIMRIKVTEGW